MVASGAPTSASVGDGQGHWSTRNHPFSRCLLWSTLAARQAHPEGNPGCAMFSALVYGLGEAYQHPKLAPQQQDDCSRGGGATPIRPPSPLGTPGAPVVIGSTQLRFFLVSHPQLTLVCLPTTSIATRFAGAVRLVAFLLCRRVLTLAQLTGRETVLRATSGLLELAHRAYTLGGARRTVKVHGGAPRHDAGGLSVGAVYVPLPHGWGIPRPPFFGTLATF